MKVEGSIIVEELDSVTRAPCSSWSAKAVVIEEPESYSGAWLRIVKGKKTVAVTLKGSQLSIVNKRSYEGKACLTVLQPRCYNILIANADVAELCDLIRYLSQFLPNATQRVHELAMGAVQLSRKRIIDSVAKEAWDNTPTKSVAHKTKRASLFLTDGKPTSLSSAALNELARSGSLDDKTYQHLPQRLPLHPLSNLSTNIPSSSSASFSMPAKLAYSAHSSSHPQRALEPISIEETISTEHLDQLSYSQQRVLNLVANRSNVFFTGSAGTGKSYLLGLLTSLFHGKRVALTSTTGITALNIGGTTVMHWSGVSADDDPSISETDATAKAISRVRGSLELSQRWRSTETLVIDEISMLSARLFTRLEAVARAIRNCDRPFGGMQVIVCGDFFQLPPVFRSTIAHGTINHQPNLTDGNAFAFECKTWSSCFPDSNIVVLSRVYRQKDDTFVRILNKLRLGTCDDDVMKALRPCMERGTRLEHKLKERETQRKQTSKNLPYQQQVGMDVDATRTSSLSSSSSSSISTSSISSLGKEEEMSEGKVCDVTEDMKEDDSEMWLLTRKSEVDEMNSRRLASLNQKLETFIARDTGSSQHTSVLDRMCPARSTLHLCIGARVMLLKNISVHEGLCNGSRGVISRFNAVGHPVVWFEATKKHVAIQPQKWTLSVGGNALASREQIPLELAWAVSVHKSQGMTINSAVCKLANVFEYGQAYVALSRMRSLDGLTLCGFAESAVRAHPRVIKFYERISMMSEMNSMINNTDIENHRQDVSVDALIKEVG